MRVSMVIGALWSARVHLREQRPRRRAQQAVDDRQAAAVRHAHLQPLHAVPRAALDERLQARQQRLATLHAKALRAPRAALRCRV